MGLWSGIKHALNSTLGTQNFKPLNEILSDLIIDGKSLVTSDEVYYLVGSHETEAVNSTYTFPLKFTMKNNGSIRLKFSMKSVYNYSTGLYVYINNNQVHRQGHSSNAQEQYEVDVNFSKNDVLTFALKTPNVEGIKGVYDITICGSVIDTSIIDVEVE